MLVSVGEDVRLRMISLFARFLSGASGECHVSTTDLPPERETERDIVELLISLKTSMQEVITQLQSMLLKKQIKQNKKRCNGPFSETDYEFPQLLITL